MDTQRRATTTSKTHGYAAPGEALQYPAHQPKNQDIMTQYRPEDKMATLIADNFQLIQVMSRFGIRVGFGDSSVKDVCGANNVDCDTFLSVVNFVMDDNTVVSSNTILSLPSLLYYLKNSHSYFLEYCFPAIRRKLLDGIQMNHGDVSFLILKFFDEYVNEVRIHMEYEDENLFAYISGRLDGKPADTSMTTYSDHHDQVSAKLRELKNIIIKYCPENADVNLLNAALYDIYRTEKELESHCQVEDYLLIPALKKFEAEKNECHGEE